MDLYSRDFLHTVLAGAEKIRADGPRSKNVGICSNISPSDKNVPLLIAELAKDWPKYSGKAMYPVPHDRMEANNAYSAYLMHHWDMWSMDEAYGRNRWELLDHVINKLSAALT